MELREFNLVLPGAPVSDANLLAFETEIGGVLDAGYKRFLHGTNGGVCKPALVSSVLDYEILGFFSLQDGWKGLRQVFGDVDEQLGGETAKYLPFAHDTGGRCIAIEVGLGTSPVFLVEGKSVDQIAHSFENFVQTLSQPQEPILVLEELARKTWADVESHINAGGDVRGSEDELSLLCQAIRCDNIEIFRRLTKSCVDAVELSDAIEIAVLNGRLQMLEILIEIGGDPEEALDMAVGPDRKQMRAFLQSRLNR